MEIFYIKVSFIHLIQCTVIIVVILKMQIVLLNIEDICLYVRFLKLLTEKTYVLIKSQTDVRVFNRFFELLKL